MTKVMVYNHTVLPIGTDETTFWLSIADRAATTASLPFNLD